MFCFPFYSKASLPQGQALSPGSGDPPEGRFLVIEPFQNKKTQTLWCEVPSERRKVTRVLGQTLLCEEGGQNSNTKAIWFCETRTGKNHAKKDRRITDFWHFPPTNCDQKVTKFWSEKKSPTIVEKKKVPHRIDARVQPFWGKSLLLGGGTLLLVV